MSRRTPNAPHLRFSDGGYRHLVTEKRSDLRIVTIFLLRFFLKKRRERSEEVPLG